MRLVPKVVVALAVAALAMTTTETYAQSGTRGVVEAIGQSVIEGVQANPAPAFESTPSFASSPSFSSNSGYIPTSNYSSSTPLVSSDARPIYNSKGFKNGGCDSCPRPIDYSPSPLTPARFYTPPIGRQHGRPLFGRWCGF